MTNATYGPTSSQPFATYDHSTSSWKTCEDSAPSDSTEYLGTWPKRGYMRDGKVYELPTLAHPTTGNDCSSLRLLPTPKASDGDRGYGLGEHRRRSPALGSVMTYYPDGRVQLAESHDLRIRQVDWLRSMQSG